MIRKSSIILPAILTALSFACVAQDIPVQSSFVALDVGVGKSEGTLAASLNLDWNIGKRRKITFGVGARFNSYLGKNQYFVTAPARLTSGSTGPGVLLKKNIPANIDTFLVKTAQLNSLNLFLSLGYNVSDRLSIRFNIDAIGFSFGKSTRGNYMQGTQGQMGDAKPTPWNILLVSDNDRGSLNSVLFARYLLNDNWGINGGIQFLFSEYTTDSVLQQTPEPNDRFRNKSLMFSAGLSYKL